MTRNLARLSDDTFDAVIVGAGVYGLATARDLAMRGFRVAILDRHDFAAAASFNSLKTIHGGIRPLQHGAVGEMRAFLRERRAVARIAPHLVRPLPFVVPTARHPVRNRAAMALFFAAYDALARDRNAGVDPANVLPRSYTVGRDACLALNPAIDPRGVTGGAVWHDYQIHASERFALALLRTVERLGGAAANYVDAAAIVVRNGRVAAVRAADVESGRTFEIRTAAVVNAAGAGAWPLLDRSALTPSSTPPPRFSVAMNLVVHHPPLPRAVGGIARGRFLFMVPWRDRSIVGTSHDEHPSASLPGALAVVPELADALLRDAITAFPRAGLSSDAVALRHRGLLPAGSQPGSLLKQSVVHNHHADGIHGLVTVVGVRYTTARATAAAAAAHIASLAGRGGPPPPTAVEPLHGADMGDLARYRREETSSSPLDAPLTARLIDLYGTGWRDVAALIAARPALGRPLAPGCDVTGAEVLHAAQAEMAVHLSDALLRRTQAGAGGHPGSAVLTAAAAIMRETLGWSAAHTAHEIDAVDAFYSA